MDACKLLDTVYALVENKKYDINCGNINFCGYTDFYFLNFYFPNTVKDSNSSLIGKYKSVIRFINHICHKSDDTPEETTTTTTTTTSTTSSTTTEAPILYRVAAYVGVENIYPETEIDIDYEINVSKTINSPVSIIPDDIGFLFFSVPIGKIITVFDMLGANITSEFSNTLVVQSEVGYEDNHIWKKQDMYDITGSTVFHIIISNP